MVLRLVGGNSFLSICSRDGVVSLIRICLSDVGYGLISTKRIHDFEIMQRNASV